jgi:RNA 2',3'-cyclic 3'-phosphodiesterase
VRLFVAIWPPPPVVAALAELERPDMGTVRWTDPTRWHVTLLFLGNPTPGGPSDDTTSATDAAAATTDAATPVEEAAVDEAAVDEAVIAEAVIAEAIARLRRVRVTAHARTVARLGAVTASFGRSVLYVPVLGLDALAGAVRTAHAPGAAGSDGTGPVPFNGHLTLGRARRRRDDVRPLAGMSVGRAGGMEWTVDELALVASVSRGGKGQYETLSTVSVPGGDYPTSNMRSGLQ